MAEPHRQLTLEIEGLDPQLAEDACFAAGAVAVTFSDARDDAVLEPAPGEVRLWPATRITALFGPDTQPEQVRESLATTLALPPERLTLEPVADRPWEREWLKDFHAMRFGTRLWVCPRHERVDEPGARVVQLDPGLAFGTGTHPSTALCLSWLDAHLQPAARVIDYGCGSGILALAAAALGARRVDAFDIDPQALIATRDNALANACAERIRLCASAAQIEPGADVLLANIIAGTLCELAPGLAALVRPGGALVLAGILRGQEADVTAAFDACFDMRRFDEREQWVGLFGMRRLAQCPTRARAGRHET